MKNYLEFEKEIKALEDEIDELKNPFGSEGISEVDTKKIKNTQTFMITSVIDNLLKGASGQAVQNMNLIFGFEENLGL